jgi:hypothetical protein
VPVWINEFHYDNSTANDPGEFIEIAATAGTDLTGWSIVLYNGGGTPTGQSYSTRSLTGLTLGNVTNGIGFLSLSYSNTVQNGSPDGIALVDNNGVVVQFLSYEGVMTASNGPATGMTSTDVGVAETNTTAPGSSLGLIGTGDEYSDFTWAVRTDDTPGGANVGQTFTAAGPVVPALSINDVSQDENTGVFTFTVTLSSPAPAGGVTFDIATANGTALAGSDYTANQATGVTIAEGQTSATFQVQVTGDADLEPNETFFVNVTNVVGATVPDGQGQGTIVNDDSPGAISVADVSYAEGDSGTTAGVFTLSRTGGSAGTVTVDYVITLPGGAGGADSSDVTATLTGTVTFLAGETSATIPFTINGDVTNEPNETFSVALSNPTGGATISDASGTATITNDDAPPAATIADAAIAEGASGVTYLSFTVTLTKPSVETVTFDYNTVANGTATPGSDYLTVSGQVSFAAGETVKTISVPIVGDQVPEANETFTILLSNPMGATVADGLATGTVTNDDGNAYFSLASGNFTETWSDTGRITADDNWSGVPHIVGYLGDLGDFGTGVDATTITGARRSAPSTSSPTRTRPAPPRAASPSSRSPTRRSASRARARPTRRASSSTWTRAAVRRARAGEPARSRRRHRQRAPADQRPVPDRSQRRMDQRTRRLFRRRDHGRKREPGDRARRDAARRREQRLDAADPHPHHQCRGQRRVGRHRRHRRLERSRAPSYSIADAAAFEGTGGDPRSPSP